jgi:hypothetical protein
MDGQAAAKAIETQSEIEASTQLPGGAFEYTCDRCGSRMNERNCKIICDNCGHRFDCSDLAIYFD